MSGSESLGTQENLALCTCSLVQSSVMDTQAVPSGVLGPGAQRWKDREEVPALGNIRKGAGAGGLEVGPGMCQLLRESREGAGHTGGFREEGRGALIWLHRAGGI